MPSKSISRRDLFKGIGIGAVAAAVPGLSQRASAQVSPPPSPSMGFKRFWVGDFELTVIQDGNVVFDPFALALDQPEGTVEAALAAHNLPPDGITTGTHPFLINTGDRLVVIDTGSGTGFGAPSSGLLDTLGTLGIARESIDTVIISHWHPDHIGANIVDGEAAFPNAQYYFPEVEWEFARAVPEDSPAAAFVPAFEAQVMPLEAEGRLTFYGDSDELVTGIQCHPRRRSHAGSTHLRDRIERSQPACHQGRGSQLPTGPTAPGVGLLRRYRSANRGADPYKRLWTRRGRGPDGAGLSLPLPRRRLCRARGRGFPLPARGGLMSVLRFDG